MTTQPLQGRIQIGPEIDYLERAFDESKYGNFSRAISRSRHPVALRSFPRPSGQHVMSIYMQYAPYKLKGTDWETQRKALGQTVVQTLTQYAPNLPELILTHQIITPQDLEETYGLTGGHIFHGELSLDQFFTMRPLLDWARYRTPIQNLYLCGYSNPSGSRIDRRIGSERRERDFERIEKIGKSHNEVTPRRYRFTISAICKEAFLYAQLRHPPRLLPRP